MADKKKILIIDDDIDIIDSISLILQDQGYDVITANSSNEGIEMAKQNTPDLVLCDMMMEAIDSGVQAATAIKENSSSVPIFLMSSIADATSDNIDINTLGLKGLIQKPIESQDLIQLVKSQIG